MYLTLQIGMLLGLAALLGAALGWFAAVRGHWVWPARRRADGTELELARRQHYDLALQNAALREQLKAMQETLAKARVEPSAEEYGQFLAHRKELEQTRRQYEVLLEQCHQQQGLIGQLQQALQAAQTRLESLQAVSAPAPAKVAMPMAAVDAQAAPAMDDLTRLPGVTASLARKLQALGIMRYRQVAAMQVDEVRRMEQLLQCNLPVALEQWIEAGMALMRQRGLLST